MSLAQLKSSMSTGLQKLKEQAQANQKSVDGRFWKPTFDKEKKAGSAVVRFLPAPQGEELPFVKIFSHNFQGPTGKWFFEKSLTTIGKRDALGLLNWKLYNSGIESDKKVAKKLRRKAEYIANILVINDPAVPENNGKVFLYKYGPQIAEIVETAMFPKDESIDSPVNPFDPWGGADFAFRLTAKTIPDERTGKLIEVPSYEKSSFKAQSCMGDDEFIDSVWKQTHKLSEFVAPDLFLTEEEFKKKLFDVLGPTVGSGIPTVEGWANVSTHDAQDAVAKPSKPVVDDFDDVPDFDSLPTTKPKKDVPKISDDSDDDIEFLKGLL